MRRASPLGTVIILRYPLKPIISSSARIAGVIFFLKKTGEKLPSLRQRKGENCGRAK
jgi:hypothetical protein